MSKFVILYGGLCFGTFQSAAEATRFIQEKKLKNAVVYMIYSKSLVGAV